MRWKKIKEKTWCEKGYQKEFDIIEKCSEQEKKTYGVDKKIARTRTYYIFRYKIENSNKEIYKIKHDCHLLYSHVFKNDYYFLSLPKAKKFVEKKVKEYNEINN